MTALTIFMEEAVNKFKAKANEFKLLGVPWFSLPCFHERDRQHLSIRALWWRETDYNRHAPSPEFMARLPRLLADAQREVANDKRERVAYAAEARELLLQACEQCLPDLNEELMRAFNAQMQAVLGADPPVFESKEERALFEQRYAVANPRWSRIPEARRRYLEEQAPSTGREAVLQ
jgi:hypothetical protein